MTKHISIIYIIIAVVLIGLAGCAYLSSIEKDEAAQVAVKIAAKRVGFAVARNNPRYTAEMITYAELMAGSTSASQLIESALPLALAKLDDYVAADPVLQSDIADLIVLIRFDAPDVDLDAKNALAKAAIDGFIAGCKLAAQY